MLFRTIKKLIEAGRIEGLEEKIDVFYAADKLTEEEYNILIEMLHEINNDENTEEVTEE